MKFEDLWKYKLLLEIDRNNYKNVKENLENIILRKYGKNKLPCKTCKKMREYEIYETTSSINMYKKQINHISFECRCKKCNTKLYPKEFTRDFKSINSEVEPKFIVFIKLSPKSTLKMSFSNLALFTVTLDERVSVSLTFSVLRALTIALTNAPLVTLIFSS